MWMSRWKSARTKSARLCTRCGLLTKVKETFFFYIIAFTSWNVTGCWSVTVSTFCFSPDFFLETKHMHILFVVLLGLFNICDKMIVAVEILVHWRNLFRQGVPLTISIERSLSVWVKCAQVFHWKNNFFNLYVNYTQCLKVLCVWSENIHTDWFLIDIFVWGMHGTYYLKEYLALPHFAFFIPNSFSRIQSIYLYYCFLWPINPLFFEVTAIYARYGSVCSFVH